jgi:hypothetical protein
MRHGEIHKWLFLFFLLVLASVAFLDYYRSDFERRTFVFYSVDDETEIVEERMLRRSDSREIDITRYVEDALLGPVTQNSLPLFPEKTKLQSLLYRDKTVYINLPEDAAMAPPEGGDVLKNLKTLHSGIKRNFPYVKGLRFFIAGKAAYTGEFRKISQFADREGL